jgi:anti-anti-sigma regulatory factor/PAS domain-containing protein
MTALGETRRRKNRRILIIDDNQAIHDDIRKILATRADTSPSDELEAALFSSAPEELKREAGTALAFAALSDNAQPEFDVSSAYQGAEGLELVRRALNEGAPYALVIVDVRIPPGWDGIETLSHLWKEDPGLQAVICSAYWDYSWNAIVRRLSRIDGFLILRKPFDPAEIRQMACALTEKWNQRVELMEANAVLERSEASNRALLQAIPDAIFRTDRRGASQDFKVVKEGAAHAPAPALGAELTPEIGRRLADLGGLAIDEGALRTSEFELSFKGRSVHYEARIVGIGGSEAVAIVRDITEHKRSAAEEARAIEREALIQAQADALAELSMPLIPINKRLVVMPLVGDMDARRVQKVRETLIKKISIYPARAAIVDFTGASLLDAHSAEEMARTAVAVRLLGVELILTGIGPTTAQFLVRIGAHLHGITTHQTLQDGIEFAMRRR